MAFYLEQPHSCFGLNSLLQSDKFLKAEENLNKTTLFNYRTQRMQSGFATTGVCEKKPTLLGCCCFVMNKPLCSTCNCKETGMNTTTGTGLICISCILEQPGNIPLGCFSYRIQLFLKKQKLSPKTILYINNPI